MFCTQFCNKSVHPDTTDLGHDLNTLNPSVVIFSLNREDKEMVELLTKRLLMYIGQAFVNKGKMIVLIAEVFATVLILGQKELVIMLLLSVTGIDIITSYT